MLWLQRNSSAPSPLYADNGEGEPMKEIKKNQCYPLFGSQFLWFNNYHSACAAEERASPAGRFKDLHHDIHCLNT